MTCQENDTGLNMDFTATTPPAPEVIEEMIRILTTVPGNPSSPHEPGLEAAKIVESARETVLSASGLTDTHRCVFTSGGSEGNSTVFHSLLDASDNINIVTSQVEHNSIRVFVPRLKRAGVDVREIKPNENGCIDPGDVVACVDRDTRLVSIMTVNNETGFIFDVAGIAREIRASFPQVRIHTDNVQGFMKIPMDLHDIDFVSVSAHKIYGPKGTGALMIRKPLLLPFIVGGSHEYGIRGGTHNVAGIAGMAKAIQLLSGKMVSNLEDTQQKRKYFLDRLEGALSNFQVIKGQSVSPYIVGLLIEGIKSEVIVRMLSEKGLFVSPGSACSTREKIRNHTANALGINPDHYLRISVHPSLTQPSLDFAADTLAETCETFRRMMTP